MLHSIKHHNWSEQYFQQSIKEYQEINFKMFKKLKA